MNPNFENTLTVEWIRHGEACSNLFENYAEDEYLDLENNNLPENENKFNYDLYAVKKQSMKSDKNKNKIIEFLDSAEPVEPAESTIEPFNYFKIKELFIDYIKKGFIQNKTYTKGDTEKYVNSLTFKDIELQIDYQKFRRELIREEEDQYKDEEYQRRIKPFIDLLIDMYNRTYKNKFGPYNPMKDKENKKKLKKITDAIRMLDYTSNSSDSNGFNGINQFEKEEKVNKMEIPQKMFASWLFIPTLSFVGVKQAEKVGETYLSEKINNYDFILLSATIRTIMTALFSVYKAMKENDKNTNTKQLPKTIIIAPYANEEYNGASIINSDFANMAIPSGIIDDMISLIMNWVKSIYSNIDEYVIIDSKQYKRITENLNYNENSNNLDKFLNFIDKELNIEKKNLSILTYTHGNFINTRRTDNKYNDGYKANIFIPFPNNLSTWIESFNYKNNIYTPNNDITRYNGTYDDQNMTLFEGVDESVKKSKKACRGSTIRKNLQITPIDELENLMNKNLIEENVLSNNSNRSILNKNVLSNNHFGSLELGSLRGDINNAWYDFIMKNDKGKKYNPFNTFDTEEKKNIQSEKLFSSFLKTSAGISWLTTTACHNWISTSEGNKWLATESGNKWLDAESGNIWLATESGNKWLDVELDKIISQINNSWLSTNKCYNWINKTSGKNWLGTISGKKWLNQTVSGKGWLFTVEGSKWKNGDGKAWFANKNAVSTYQSKGGSLNKKNKRSIKKNKKTKHMKLFKKHKTMKKRTNKI